VTWDWKETDLIVKMVMMTFDQGSKQPLPSRNQSQGGAAWHRVVRLGQRQVFSHLHHDHDRLADLPNFLGTMTALSNFPASTVPKNSTKLWNW
jgi:hypothetical protein